MAYFRRLSSAWEKKSRVRSYNRYTYMYDSIMYNIASSCYYILLYFLAAVLRDRRPYVAGYTL